MINEIGFYRLQCCFVHVAVEAKMWPSNEVPNCQSVKNFVQVAAFAEITCLFVVEKMLLFHTLCNTRIRCRPFPRRLDIASTALDW